MDILKDQTRIQHNVPSIRRANMVLDDHNVIHVQELTIRASCDCHLCFGLQDGMKKREDDAN